LRRLFLDEIQRLADEKRLSKTGVARLIFEKKDGDRILRALEAGDRKVSIEDLCKLANFIGEHPSYILAKAELIYKTSNDIRNPTPPIVKRSYS